MKRSLVFLGLAVLAVALLVGAAQAPRAAALSFAPHADFGTGPSPTEIAVGDFNKDGKADLVTANYDAGTVSVLLGNGSGGFGAKADFATGTFPHSVAVGDLNGDGKPDLVAADYTANTVSVLLNTTSGGVLSFATKSDFATSNGPYSVAVGDFDSDGEQDLATANVGRGNVNVLLGNAGFGTKSDVAMGAMPVGVAVGDFNKDGKLDLATANYGATTVSVVLNTTSGGVLSFASSADFAAGGANTQVAVGDLNRDGKQDLATANFGVDTASLLLGDGSGGFTKTATDPVTGTQPNSVAVGDFNGDGRRDLVTANYASAGTVSVLLGHGDGTFSARSDFTTGAYPESVAVGDFNRDGKADLVTADQGANSASVLLNTTKPRIGSLRPRRGRLGATVTISGWGFGSRRATSKVLFGSKAATKYALWSKGKIKVKVPRLSEGRKAVRVKTADGRSNAKYFRVI